MAASRAIGYFSAWDYVVLAAMLVVSAAVGFYYARAGQNTTKDFLMGGRSMSAVPVAMSLTASFMSAIAVLGIPSEVYRFGAIYAVCGFTYIIMALISGEIFLPFFYRLGITSTYEYLELRFNRYVRIIGTVIFICLMVLYTGIVIYTPALALNQVTGLNLWGAVVITGGVCTFYCTVGGLKAVVWTDVFQIVIMVAGFAAVIIRSVVVQGGISRIMHDAYEGGRLNFWNFDPSPLKRHTFWTILIGGTIGWIGVYGTNQSQVQRYIACRSRCQAKLSLYINLVGLWVIVGSAVLCGLCLYSIYRDCDPWTSKVLTAPDQLLPYLVMDILQNYPGVPGLFIACAYSGTLSTVSSTINALATITVEDFFKHWFQSLSDRKLSWIAKGTSVFYGVLCIAMAAVASLMGGVIQAAGSIFGMVGAPLLGLFSLGMFFPFTNSKGAMVGLISGCTLTIWAGIGSHIYPPPPESQMLLNLSTAGCNISGFEYSNNWTLTTEMPAFTTSVQSVISERPAITDYWYSISYLHLNTIGLFTTLTVGILVSLLTGGRKQQIDKKYLFCKEDFGYDIISCWRTEKRQNTEDLSMTQQPKKKPLEGRENPAFLMPHELCRL